MIDQIRKPYSFLKNYINQGHSRSVNAKKNILLSLVVKGLTIGVSFLVVPLTLYYLDTTNYGIWLTLTSFVSWLSFFDIGLGNGLRNRFAEALSKGDTILARRYVSTTYAILGIIILAVFIVFIFVNPYINWIFVFNAPPELAKDLTTVVLFVFTFFCLQFLLNLIGVILTADQKTGFKDLLGLIASVLSLIVVYLLSKTTQSSLLLYGITFSGSTALVYLIVSIVLFNSSYKMYAPRWKFVSFTFARDLLNLGVQFFIIQIVGIVMFSTDNIIISHLFGPAEVGAYNIAFKYFGMCTMAFSILCAPFWSAYTEAYAKGDFDWIHKINHNLKISWVFLVLASVILLIISPYFYSFWIGEKLTIPFVLSLSMFVYVVTINWGAIFVTFINGVGKIRLQLYISIIAGVLNIPLSILFAKTFNLGPAGIILATTLCLSYGPILAPIQYKRIISNTAKGIWNK
ncbi:MATE family efflux transporter [Chryseolinea sp. H1M3-3]|uniref:lipopolysaccharide biosynthesis protein n=1 Tax=Chryseolinea sp. H1M3-3 TaxID=3034144 RepID=UPI0023EC17FF|nr:MATE family efflux transporter [Chryseolinea sp. H1M3-3]